MSESINECSPITIYPMGVTCLVTNPSTFTSSDGSATLIVTGGTPPYNVSWDNGNNSFTIMNLSVGEYPATVIDFYGDFTINTTCILTAETPTSTTTTSTTTEQPTYDFCMTIVWIPKKSEIGLSISKQIHFIPNGIYDGYPTWISDDSIYSVIWNVIEGRWELVDTVNNLTVINNNPAYPPLSGWVILGVKGTVTVDYGECGNVDNLALDVTVNNKGCDYQCLNSLTIVGSGGAPPYQYSINGGITWSTSPIFQNLCVGLYSPQIKDSTNTIVVGDNVNVNGIPCTEA